MIADLRLPRIWWGVLLAYGNRGFRGSEIRWRGNMAQDWRKQRRQVQLKLSEYRTVPAGNSIINSPEHAREDGTWKRPFLRRWVSEGHAETVG
jgi:hypothetical protein